MLFEEIFLLPDEIKLLRDMTDGKEWPQDAAGIAKLRTYDLIDLARSVPSKETPRSFSVFYKINKNGERFLHYLDEKSASDEHKCFMDVITIIGVIASIVAAIASIIAALK